MVHIHLTEVESFNLKSLYAIRGVSFKEYIWGLNMRSLKIEGKERN